MGQSWLLYYRGNRLTSWSFSFTQQCLTSYYGSQFLLGKLVRCRKKMLERRRWWSLANALAFSAKRKTGMGKKAGSGMKRKKSEKTFYWCWCWVWQLPLSKNKLPVAVGDRSLILACPFSLVPGHFSSLAVHSWACYLKTSITYYVPTIYQAPCYMCGWHTLSHLIFTVNKFQSWYSHPGLSDSKAGSCNNKNHVTLFWRCCAQMISPGSTAHVSHVWWKRERFLATNHTLVDG